MHFKKYIVFIQLLLQMLRGNVCAMIVNRRWMLNSEGTNSGDYFYNNRLL
jgi:hypothetical protein